MPFILPPSSAIVSNCLTYSPPLAADIICGQPHISCIIRNCQNSIQLKLKMPKSDLFLHWKSKIILWNHLKLLYWYVLIPSIGTYSEICINPNDYSLCGLASPTKNESFWFAKTLDFDKFLPLFFCGWHICNVNSSDSASSQSLAALWMFGEPALYFLFPPLASCIYKY